MFERAEAVSKDIANIESINYEHPDFLIITDAAGKKYLRFDKASGIGELTPEYIDLFIELNSKGSYDATALGVTIFRFQERYTSQQARAIISGENIASAFEGSDMLLLQEGKTMALPEASLADMASIFRGLGSKVEAGEEGRYRITRADGSSMELIPWEMPQTLSLNMENITNRIVVLERSGMLKEPAVRNYWENVREALVKGKTIGYTRLSAIEYRVFEKGESLSQKNIKEIKKEAKEIEDGVKRTNENHKKRIEVEVPDLYESILPEDLPMDESIKTIEDKVTYMSADIVHIKTIIKPTKGGIPAYFSREYNLKDKVMLMLSASKGDLPSWINDVRVPLRKQDNTMPNEEFGIPIQTYVTLRQMKILGLPRNAFKKVKMKSIENIRTILEIENYMKINKIEDINLIKQEFLLKTHSLQYAKTVLTQSGHKIKSVKIILNDGYRAPLNEIIPDYNMPQEYKKFDILETDEVYFDFDISIELE